MRTSDDVLSALDAAGITPFIREARVNEDARGNGQVSGVVEIGVLLWLHQHSQFQNGPWHRLHPEIPRPRTEFRSFRGAVADDLSLQFVMNTLTGQFHSDLDKYSAYADVVNIVGHVVGEVAWPKLRKVGRKFKGCLRK